MEEHSIKLITETSSGSLIKSPAKIKLEKGRIYFVKSPFSLKDEIKAMAGSKWHGFDEKPRKFWSISDSFRNKFQLAYMAGEEVYDWFDRPLVRHEYARPLMEHQKDLSDSGLTYHYQIWGADMGCIDGEAIVHVNRAGRGMKMKLRDLYLKFHGQTTRGRSWDLSIPTYVRSLKGETLGLHGVKDVLHKGIKQVVLLTLKSGKTLKLTPDHEVCIGYGQFKPIEDLIPGDTVFTNGTWIDKDGYVRVGGLKGKHPRCTTGGVYEHILVMEKKIGRQLKPDERVHHKNGIRHDNRPENLELMASDSEHASHHAKNGGFKRLDGGRSINGGEVHFVPKVDVVKSITEAGKCEVFDIVMEDPHRNFVANGVVVHNCGKTLSAQEVIEHSNKKYWYWVGPKSSLPNMEREFKKWNFPGLFEICDLENAVGPEPATLTVKAITYERLVQIISNWNEDDAVPHGVIFDEASKCKTPTSQRSQAAQILADMIRNTHGMGGYVIEMSGTPSPKRPTDWWSLSEIAWPGFLREGSVKALENRLAFKVLEEFDSGAFWKTKGWKDSDLKCDICGEEEDHLNHQPNEEMDFHQFEPAKNEVAYMYERLKGLVVVKHSKDCMALPDKQYRTIHCPPSKSVQRVAKALVDSAQNAVTGMTWLRELSDGFQYRDIDDGTMACNHCQDGEVEEWFNEDERIYKSIDMLDPGTVAKLQKRKVPCPKCDGTGQMRRTKRISKMVPCPKESALKGLLEECEETGRIVVFAGFTASVDRVVDICRKEGWSVVRCDGRGYQVTDFNGDLITDEKPLDYWANKQNARVAFVAHPESGGMSLTLTESRMAVYWSNSFKPEYRVQSEKRIHRKGMDENIGCIIVDLIHLPTDERVLEIIKENRKLELMTMGEITQGLECATCD